MCFYIHIYIKLSFILAGDTPADDVAVEEGVGVVSPKLLSGLGLVVDERGTEPVAGLLILDLLLICGVNGAAGVKAESLLGVLVPLLGPLPSVGWNSPNILTPVLGFAPSPTLFAGCSSVQLRLWIFNLSSKNVLPHQGHGTNTFS